MKDFLKSALSDVNGQVSSNRLLATLIILFLLITSSVVAVTTWAIPEVSQSWVYLIGIFVGGALGGKATEAIKTFGNASDQ